MILINISERTKFSELANRDLKPGARSADMDRAGLFAAMEKVVSCCGRNFSLKLNKKERAILDRFMDLEKAGQAAVITPEPRHPTQLEIQLKKDAEAKAAKIASISEMKQKEESIMRETTYASSKDIDAAKSKSLSIQGEVAAKKLDKKQDEPISLSDLIGDNKFIEESMKHSKIKTAVASEEGWDMDKINAPKVQDDAETKKEPANDAPAENEEHTAEEKPAKKTSRRRRKESK